MSKTKEELNALKEEVETESKKPHELTEEDLDNVTGGIIDTYQKITGEKLDLSIND